MNNIVIYSLVTLLILNVVITAIRAGILNIRYGRLLAMQEKEDDLKNTIALITNRTHTRAALKLSQIMIRFSIIALGLFLFIPYLKLNYSLSLILLSLVVASIFMWIIEFIVEFWILKSPGEWAIKLTPLAQTVIKIISPLLIFPFKLYANEKDQNFITITEEELKSLVKASEEAGEIEQDEAMLINSVFRFDDMMVKEVMIPRVDIFGLEVNTPIAEASQRLLDTGFSRVPVYETQTDNILGFLYTKDMLKVWVSSKRNEDVSLRDLLREVKYVPEFKKIDEVLREMQADHNHIAIVVDEYGGISGLVTLEDIIEEIFGEIQDEYDEQEEALYQEIKSGEYLFVGHALLEEVNNVVGGDLPIGEADTLGGLIFNRLREVPEIGETLIEKGLTLTVEEMEGRRIKKVSVINPKQMQSGSEAK